MRARTTLVILASLIGACGDANRGPHEEPADDGLSESGDAISGVGCPSTIVAPGANSVAWDQVPFYPHLFVGRYNTTGTSEGSDGSTRQSLILAEMSGDPRATLTYKSTLFDSLANIIIVGPYTIKTAYDPVAFWAHDELWVAFECTDVGHSLGTAICMGPVNRTSNDGTGWYIEGARTTVILYENIDADGYHSASVPKLFWWRGQPYMYYSVVHKYPNGNWKSASTRGIQLRWTGPGGVFWEVHSDGPAPSVDWRSVEVLAPEPTHPFSNQLADSFGVYTEGAAGSETAIYLTGAVGGHGVGGASCLATYGANVSVSRGCYRMAVWRSTLEPLTPFGFNYAQASEFYQSFGRLPWNPIQYLRQFQSPSTGATCYMAQFLPLTPGDPVDWGANNNPYCLQSPCSTEMRGMTLAGPLSSLWYASPSATWTAGGAAWNVGETVYLSSHKLVYQTDGNLVIYTADDTPVWSTQYTPGCSDGHSCVGYFQGDGNSVLYRDGVAYWASGTNGSYFSIGSHPYLQHVGAIYDGGWNRIWP